MIQNSQFEYIPGEYEADIQVVDYLTNAQINPEPFANFLYYMENQEQDVMQYLTWLNTHPNSKERAAYIIEYSANLPTDFEPIILEST